jgi:ectoine hydroxylase-related dioxygenase (phytanoyl-CoA dioxygenase family)
MDLSLKHEPVSDLFRESEPTTGCLISDALAENFMLDGFITGVPLLNADQMDALREELEELMRPEQAGNELFYEYNINESSGGGRLFHALGAWRVSAAFHDLIFSERAVRCAEKLLGAAVRLWHDQAFVKPAHDGAAVAWHQDYSYWTRTVPLAHLTCWIGLDDSTEANGCVQYVPGSHQWHLLPRGDLAGDMEAVFNYLNAEQRDAFFPVPAVMRAGEASFHHPMTVHGSFENTSKSPRRGIVINFMRDGVRSNSYEPLLEGLPLIQMGEKLEGQFFPLLSKPSL